MEAFTFKDLDALSTCITRVGSRILAVIIVNSQFVYFITLVFHDLSLYKSKIKRTRMKIGESRPVRSKNNLKRIAKEIATAKAIIINSISVMIERFVLDRNNSIKLFISDPFFSSFFIIFPPR